MVRLTLALLVLRIGAEHHNLAFAADDLALLTHRFNGWSHFHLVHSSLPYPLQNCARRYSCASRRASR